MGLHRLPRLPYQSEFGARHSLTAVEALVALVALTDGVCAISQTRFPSGCDPSTWRLPFEGWAGRGVLYPKDGTGGSSSRSSAGLRTG
jgi:hypothetical protein